MPKARKTDSSANVESAAKKSASSPTSVPSSAEDFEKLGVFYLGRPYDLETKQAKSGWLLFDSKDLVTHAVRVVRRKIARFASIPSPIRTGRPFMRPC